MNLPKHNVFSALERAAAFTATAGVGGLVVIDGQLPSAFSTLFFVPIIFVAYRYPLSVALVVAGLASFFSSPAMALFGVRVDDSVLPVLWTGWPAVYLFLAVSLNQWSSIQEQRSQLDFTEQHLLEVRARNDKREQELETLSAIHTTIISGSDETAVVEEITRRVAEVCGAKACMIMVPVGTTGLRPFLPVGFTDEVFARFFPNGAPYGEGVDGWAILHKRVAASQNVFRDPRYERLKDFAAVVGFASAAAAPVELDQETFGALVVCYADEREFTPEELTRLERLAGQTELAIRSVRQRESLARFAFDTALALTEAIESRDPYTGDHCRRLAEHAALTAARLALPPRDIEIVRLGAALHDMGKIVVPDSILKKADKLTPEEYAVVKQHCYSGGQICKRVGFLMNAYPIVYHHHERWDGKGYPDGLSGERVPQGARIVAVVDAFDAMTTDRPYRKAMRFDEAEAILRDGAGGQWDPTIVTVFLDTVTVRGDPHPEDGHHADGHRLDLPHQLQGSGEHR
ncbi:MAG: HD domain-containing protein [Dehalococcoidia bacterium]|nr:HD domain-containing protein [Dehalococcoidia bacterium]